MCYIEHTNTQGFSTYIHTATYVTHTDIPVINDDWKVMLMLHKTIWHNYNTFGTISSRGGCASRRSGLSLCTDRRDLLDSAVFPCLLLILLTGQLWNEMKWARGTSEQVSDQQQITCFYNRAALCYTVGMAIRWWYSLNALSGTFLAWHSSQQDGVWSKLIDTVFIESTSSPASSWSLQSLVSSLSQV